MSRESSPAAPVSAPSAKVKNPDLGAQTSPGPQVGTLPPAKPVKALQDYGVFMNMDDVNRNVDQLINAHMKSLGYPPSPGLVFDVLKSQGITGPIDYNDLFGIPRNKHEAQAMIFSRSLASPDPLAALPILTPDAKQLVDGATAALKKDTKTSGIAYMNGASNYAQYMQENVDAFDEAMKDPQQRETLVQGLQKAGFQHVAAGLPEQIQSAGWVPHGVTKVVGTAIGQIAYSTVNMPFGFYQLARGLGLDAYDLATVPSHALALARLAALGPATPGDVQKAFPHTSGIAERMAEQVAQDVAHPLRNPGYLMMDIWAAATLGGGTAAKLGRIGAIARDSDLTLAQKVGQSAKAALPGVKLPPKATDLGFSAYHEQVPLSDTAIVRAIQEHTPIFGREARQERLIANQTDGFDQVDHHILTNSLMSSENQLRRARAGRLQIQYAVAMTDVVEMQRLAGWASRTRSALSDLKDEPSANWNSLNVKQKVGVEKALQILFTDDLDPWGTWHDFHTKQIDALNTAHESLVESGELEGGALKRASREFDYSIKAHSAQLEALDLAHDILTDPPKRFKPLLDRAYQVAKDQQRLKEIYLGLDPQVAENHLAEMGAVLRGHSVIDLGEGAKGITEEDPAPLLKKIAQTQNRLKNAQTSLNKAKAKLRLHPAREDFKDEVANAQRTYDRHDKQLGIHQRKLEDLRGRAIPLERVVKGQTLFDTSDMQGNMIRAGLDENSWDDLHEALGRLGENSLTYEHVKAHLHREIFGNSDYIDMAQKALYSSTEEAQEGLKHAQENLRAIKSSGKKGQFADNPNFEETYYRLEIEEAHQYLAGDIKGARETRAMLIAHTDDNVFSGLATTARQESLHDTLRRFGFSGIKHGDEITRFGSPIEQAVAEAREGGSGSAYFKSEPEKYRRRGGAGSRFVNKTRYGVRPPAGAGNTRFPFKSWTGDSLQLGDMRWDTSNLLAEQFGVAYHAATKITQWRDLWNSAVDSRITPYHEAIRDINQVPDELRELVQGLERQAFDQKNIKNITDEKLQKLSEFLYPSKDEMENVHGHVKFVDSRLILDKVGGVNTGFWDAVNWSEVDKFFSGLMTPINEPMRLMLIFATPAYALNALGAAALQGIHEGFLAPNRFGRALHSNAIYGGETTRLLDRLAGNTFTHSLVSERNLYTKGSQIFQEGWQKFTDVMFRRAAVIHELKRHGLLNEDLSAEDVLAELKHPDNADKVNQAAQAARKAMLDFNSMSWPERATLRHIFFVYSFVRSSAVWSLRFLRDHGFMSDALAQAGKDRAQNIDKLLGKMPDWFMRTGYFAVAPHTIYNPIQWNMPGMLEQTGAPLAAIFGHVPYATPADLLGPAAQFAYGAVTGNDTSGKALPEPSGFLAKLPGSHGNLARSFLDLWQQTPVGQIAVKQGKAARQKPLPAPPVRSGFLDPISSALQRERAGLNDTVFENDGWWNTWGLALFRSGMPRQVNTVAGAARYWRDLRATNPKAYHQHEIEAVRSMVARQEKVLGEQAPPEVVDAVDTIAHVSQAIEDYKTAHSGEPTPNQKTINQITIQTLAAEGKIKDPQKWLDENKNALDLTEVKAVQMQVLEAAGGKAWRDWATKVSKIDDYAQPKYDAWVHQLNVGGLGDYTATTKAPRPERWAYGRQVENTLQKAKELAATADAKSGYDQQIAQQEWLRYVNDNDKPIKINGRTFPSPFAIQFASKTPAQQKKALATYANKKPAQMTALQMQLLTGQRPDPIVSQGWETLESWLKQERDAQPFGKALPSGAKAFFLKTLMAKSPAFSKAVKFAHQPLAKRLLTYNTIQNSPNAGAWNWLLGGVSQTYDTYTKAYTDNGKVKMNLVTQAWKEKVPAVQQELESRYGQRFLSELGLYSGATSPTNSDAYLTKFLIKLMQP